MRAFALGGIAAAIVLLVFFALILSTGGHP
jgi:hypothetical protein